MKKTPTIFKRDPQNMQLVTSEPHPDCDWVFNGEGVATRKYDGTCCLIRDGVLYKRRELKKGEVVPEHFELADYDEVTKKTVGWMPVLDTDPADKWHVAAIKFGPDLADGTYELLGEKIQGNLEKVTGHILLKHSDAEVLDAPRTFAELRDWIEHLDIEGLVFHHEDGRMAKIKKRDFGFAR